MGSAFWSPDLPARPSSAAAFGQSPLGLRRARRPRARIRGELRDRLATRERALVAGEEFAPASRRRVEQRRPLFLAGARQRDDRQDLASRTTRTLPRPASRGSYRPRSAAAARARSPRSREVIHSLWSPAPGRPPPSRARAARTHARIVVRDSSQRSPSFRSGDPGAERRAASRRSPPRITPPADMRILAVGDSYMPARLGCLAS